MSTAAAIPWFWTDLPPTAYPAAYDLQKRLVAARKSGALARNALLCLEHPSVFTLGRRGGRDNLVVSEAFLEEKGVPVVPIERGGDITYHGPGQIVVYPILHLTRSRLRVVELVEHLETAMIQTAAWFGVAAERNPLNRGVWAGTRKLGSIGIAITRSISFHGLAFNVNTDLTPFSWINPCGLKGVGVTSLQRELGRALDMQTVRAALRDQLAVVFDVPLEKLAPGGLYEVAGIAPGAAAEG